MLKKRLGQSTMEYFIMVAAVLVVLLIFLGPNGLMRRRIDQTLDDSIEFMDAMVDNIDLSQ